MPDLTEYPSTDDDGERSPDPERIIDRIISGQLVPAVRPVPDS